MADTDKLRKYTRGDMPTIDGNDRRFFQEELRKLQVAISLLVDTAKELEARIAAGGL
jgi:hypothetical protein